MKAMFVILALLATAAPTPGMAADALAALDGTWSGDWTPQDGVPDAVTVQLAREPQAKLTGKFVTPTPMDFTTSSYDAKTRTVALEAVDQTSGKHYTIRGTVKGTEITGTMKAGNVAGKILLIKWTYLGSSGNFRP